MDAPPRPVHVSRGAKRAAQELEEESDEEHLHLEANAAAGAARPPKRSTKKEEDPLTRYDAVLRGPAREHLTIVGITTPSSRWVLGVCAMHRTTDTSPWYHLRASLLSYFASS